MKEAYLYEKLDNNKVRCFACSHRCLILDDKRGICRVRENREGILYSLVYEKVLGLAIDPIEKKPLYNFYPKSKILSFGTVGCNFKCDFCQNFHMSCFKEIIGEDISIKEIIANAKKYNCIGIAYTYNEPTIFAEMVYDCAKLAKEKGLKNVIVTNGYMSKEWLDLIGPYIDAVNIDLKSFRNEFYKKVCKSSLQPVLDNIKKMYEMGIHLEITTLIIPGENDSKEELDKIVNFIAGIDINIPWHISRFFPTHLMSDSPRTPRETLEMAKNIGKSAGLKYVYLGNV
jgi:pyruvate formate lyase activating enzyme